LVCGVYYQLHETPAVHAAALLQRAVAAAQNPAAAHAAHPHRIQFRTRTAQFIRTAGMAGAPASPIPPVVQARFEAAHYNAADPLSAHAFQTWREGVPQKEDEVATVPDPVTPAENCYRIRTSPAAGEVASATLMLRTGDLHPVEGVLQFRDQEFIEFSELTEDPAGVGEPIAAAHVGTPERPAEPPSRLAAVPPGSSASVTDELQVLSALHQIGADLGETITVKLSDGKVLVTGEGIDAQRQTRIRDILESMPHVAVQFSEPSATGAETPAVPPAPANPARGSTPNLKIQARLEEQVGGRAEFERFSASILDSSERAMSQAYALRRLAQQFPPDRETGMNSGDRQALHELARQHTTALMAEMNGMYRALSPALVALGASQAKRPVSTAAGWQPAAEDVLRDSRRVEVLLSILTGVAAGQTSEAALPGEMLNAFAELRASLDRCQHLLAQEGGG
jgi:hypothetical protein